MEFILTGFEKSMNIHTFIVLEEEGGGVHPQGIIRAVRIRCVMLGVNNNFSSVVNIF